MSRHDDAMIFTDAEWYDRSINWAARLEREIPVLLDVFGLPGEGGLIDAGCGTGRQTIALAQRGYAIVGTDASEEMLELARRHAREVSQDVAFRRAPFETMHDVLGGGFDGIYSLGNALAAAGSRGAVEQAIDQFSRCLRPGGQLFLQVLNFPLMRAEQPCVRGPRVATVDGREYLSVRHFHFGEDFVDVVNVTLWQDDGWHIHARSGQLYPVNPDELQSMCERVGLRIDEVWGSYAREPFDPISSIDLLVVATRRESE